MKPTGPQEAELKKDFIRVQSDEDVTRVLVTVITWDGPATPIGTWVETAALPANADTRAVESEVRRIFHNRKYFRRCGECGELNLRGHMYNLKYCMGCAERNHGVVY